MDANESDSSLEDTSDYIETGVLLGYATKEPTDDTVSHLGGHPAWYDPAMPSPASLAQCKCCMGYMSLLLQLNGDLPKYFPQDERRLHIFCCRKKTCSRKPGAIRALREVKRYRTDGTARTNTEKNKAAEAQPMQDLGAALFGTSTATTAPISANPFSSPDALTSKEMNPFSSIAPSSSLASKPPQAPASNSDPPTETFAQKLRISDPPASIYSAPAREPWPSETSFPPPFPRYNLDADYETLAPDKPETQAANGIISKSQYDAEDTGNEKDTADMTLDKAFHKFARRIAQNPEQVLRYEFGGQPLLYSGTDSVAPRFIVPHNKAGAIQGMPRCDNCDAGRVFELQLVPGLIEALEADDEIDFEDGMDWGTVILGVCSKNCAVAGEVAFREEWVGVQWEERVKYKK